MINSLLKYSLERVSSLEHFYKEELKHIETKSLEGQKMNEIGYLALMYMSVLASNTLNESDEELDDLIAKVKKYMKIEIESSDEGVTKFRYEYINEAELRQQGYELDIDKSLSAYYKYIDMPIIHANNTLIMLITRFEEFISALITEIYLLYPQKYLNKQQISFSEIANCKIEDICDKIVRREVDAIMRQSFMDWFELFESHGFKFDSCRLEIENLKEIYARRNILVHNAGVVNDIYLKNVPSSTAKIGEYLYATNQYLPDAFQTIRTLILTIMLEAVRLVNKNKDKYLDSIFKIAYGMLQEKKYVLSKHVFNALKKHKNATNDIKEMSQINYWLSVKGIEGTQPILNEIRAFDVSALNKKFHVAKLILLEDYKTATLLISDMYSKNEIDTCELIDWPLFEDYRQSEDYKVFKDKHHDDFTKYKFKFDKKGANSDDTQS